MCANGPYRSDEETFLGIGYYLWEGIIEHAIWWGKTFVVRKHQSSFFVLRCDIEFDGSTDARLYLDLLGSDTDKRLMRGLIDDASAHGYDTSGINLGEYIDFLRELNEEMPGIFPYRVIRALDATNPRDSAHSVFFKRGSSQLLDLSPRVMVCFHDKKDVLLHPVRVVHP